MDGPHCSATGLHLMVFLWKPSPDGACQHRGASQPLGVQWQSITTSQCDPKGFIWIGIRHRITLICKTVSVQFLLSPALHKNLQTSRLLSLLISSLLAEGSFIAFIYLC